MTNLKLPPEYNLERVVGSAGDVGELDLRYFPITVIKFVGNPTEQLVKNYYEWRRKASAFCAKNGTIHIMVVDMMDWGVPKPTIRAAIGEQSSLDKDEVGLAWQYLVIASAVMRGAITAIVWMRGDSSAYSFCPSFKEAMSSALRMYEDRGLTPPKLDPTTYEFRSS